MLSQVYQLAIVMTPAAAPQERVWAEVGIRQLPGMVGLSGVALFAPKVSEGKEGFPMPPRLFLAT